MKISPLIIISLFFFWSPEIIFSQGLNPKFKNITVEDGLTQNTVTEILQDYDGFMWFATEDGLNRYDGYNIKQFRQIPHGTTNTLVSRIGEIKLLRDSTLWIQTYYNSNCYTAYNKNVGFKTVFEFFPSVDFEGYSIKDIFYDSSKNYWLALGSENSEEYDKIVVVGSDSTFTIEIPNIHINNYTVFFEDCKHTIWFSDSKTELIKLSFKNQIPSFKKIDMLKGVFEMTLFSPNYFLISTSSNLIKLDFDGKIVDTLYTVKAPNRISNIFVDSGSTIWGSSGFDSFFFLKDGQITSTRVNKKTYKSSPFINSIEEDKLGNIWLGTTGEGIYIFNKKDEKFSILNGKLALQNTLAHPFIDKIYKDRDNNIWVGTLERGVSAYVVNNNKFNTIHNNPFASNSLPNNIVRSICMDSLGHIWFGTRGGGIAEYDRHTGTFKQHFSNSNFHYESLEFENDSILWIGTRDNGILKYNIQTERIISIPINRTKNPSLKYQKYVRKIYKDTSDNLWFATWGGLIKINLKTNEYEEIAFKSNLDYKNPIGFNTVFTILQIKKTEYLVGTESGILRINESGNILENYQHAPNIPESLSNNTVFNIFMDSQSRIWVGTFTGGLNLLDLESGSCENYRMKDGLPNDCIYGILEDNNGNLWLSTNNGLSCFKPQDKSFTNYFKSDGLLSSSFNFGAFAEIEKEFFFGTEEGVIYFSPAICLQEDQSNKILSIIDFHVYNSTKNFDYFKRNKKTIILEPEERIFRISMVSPTYDHPERTVYEYKISPLQNDWIDHGNDGTFIFNNLPHGKFKLNFRVKGDDKKQNNTLSIPLIIKPPFFKTIFFKFLVIFTVLSILLLIVWFRFRQIKKLERIRLQIARDLHDEIGSTLSRISFSGYKIMQNDHSNLETKNYGKQIMDLSRRTADSIREVLWFINPQNDHFTLVLEQMKQLAENLFSDKELIVTISAPIPDPGSLKIKRNLFLIYKEIITNIAKHANAKKVTIQIQWMENCFTLSISDNGKGFDTQKSSKGMGLSNIKRRVKELRGTINIQSAIGEGSFFEIKIPSWKKRFRLF